MGTPSPKFDLGYCVYMTKQIIFYVKELFSNQNLPWFKIGFLNLCIKVGKYIVIFGKLNISTKMY